MNQADRDTDAIFDAWQNGDFSELDAKAKARWSETELAEMARENQWYIDND